MDDANFAEDDIYTILLQHCGCVISTDKYKPLIEIL